MASFYEFFAGGGMARAGLGDGWACLFSNDFDEKKAASYEANWGCDALRVCDVATVRADDLPGHADLAWASFPCQDLSLAGGGAGLRGERSGAFWPFWQLMDALDEQERAPKLIVLENVMGALTSHEGRDFSAILKAMVDSGYRVGALVMDAARFVPQSRQRLFIVGVHRSLDLPQSLVTAGPDPLWHPTQLVDAWRKKSPKIRNAWVWWSMPAPAPRSNTFADLIEEVPAGVLWHTSEETKRLLGMMSPLHLKKVEQARNSGRRQVGTIYKRTRIDPETGSKVQRAEVRFDDIAGCLRTPSGGSSRQLILVVDGKKVRSRLLSPREAASLMGLPENYRLPRNYNDAYHLAGDGVVVPVVSHLSQHLLGPILRAQRGDRLMQVAA